MSLAIAGGVMSCQLNATQLPWMQADAVVPHAPQIAPAAPHWPSLSLVNEMQVLPMQHP
jgi:hypothetical protein